MIKPWLTIKNFKFTNFKKIGLKKLNSKNFKTSPWIDNIVKKNNIKLDKNKLPIFLIKVKVKGLGFNKPTQLYKIYNKAKLKGYDLVAPEIALYSRLLFTKQKKGEWIRFATPLKAMVDSDGVPHLPKLGRALGKYFIETYWSYPKAIFHPHNEFIFIYKKN